MCSPHLKSEAAKAAGLLRGERKSDSSLGVAARGSKALPGSQGHEISSSEQAGSKNSLPLRTCCPRIDNFCGLGCCRGGSLTLAWASHCWAGQEVSRGQVSLQTVQLKSYLPVPRPHIWDTGPKKANGVWPGAWMS